MVGIILQDSTTFVQKYCRTDKILRPFRELVVVKDYGRQTKQIKTNTGKFPGSVP